jgi:serine/threonine protein kinase
VALSTTDRERGELTPERWQQISRIFKSAISLDSEARAAYVADKCGVDQSLRDEVEKLIASHQQASAEGFIDGIAAEAGAELLIDEAELEHRQSRLGKGQQLGSYLILDALGAGGMGEVYLAKDSRLDRTVALKVLSQDISSDHRRMLRFRQEAKIASSLNQPNILTIFEFGEVDGLTFLATEFIDGETLRDSLNSKRLKLGEILEIAIQVLTALDAAHEARIVHRDIKPENVMIRRRDRVVKVLDFGLAKVTERKSSMLTGHESEAATEFKTAPRTLMGTINYMSPEQAQLHAVDERTDIWSTGVMIYEMVSGLMPFKGATESHTIVQIIEKDPVPLSNFTQRKAPVELQRIVSKALSKSPDERYQTAKDMLIDLRTLKKQLDVEAEMERTSSPTTPLPAIPTDQIVPGRPQKKRVLAIALIGMAVVTAAIFGINIWRSSRARTNASIASPPVPPVTSEERTLTYWVTVQKFRGGKAFQEPFTLASEINFELDYHIRINVRSPQTGHLYILNEGPTREPEYVILFPSPTANNGSAFLAKEQLVRIPEETWIRFDADQGVEKLWFVFAEAPITELEAVKKFANQTDDGLINDVDQRKAVQSFLSSHATPAPKHEKEEKQTVVKSPGKVLVYAIRLEHH